MSYLLGGQKSKLDNWKTDVQQGRLLENWIAEDMTEVGYPSAIWPVHCAEHIARCCPQQLR